MRKPLTARRLAAFPVDLDDMTAAYLECAVWASTDDNGRSLDNDYDTDAFTARARDDARRECADFLEWATQANNPNHVAPEVLTAHGAERCGHDFWLTRNRHGAGFWDRGLGEDGRKLTECTRPYGSCDVYVNRRRLHFS